MRKKVKDYLLLTPEQQRKVNIFLTFTFLRARFTPLDNTNGNLTILHILPYNPIYVLIPKNLKMATRIITNRRSANLVEDLEEEGEDKDKVLVDQLIVDAQTAATQSHTRAEHHALV